MTALSRRTRKRRRPLSKRGPRRLGKPSWKVVGLAGIAGVAATGVVVARNRREHRDLPPDELRARLHSRLAATAAADAPDTGPPPA
jgi:hypothetical protein